MRRTIEIKLSVEIDDELVSKDDLLQGFDRVLMHSDGVGCWGEIVDKKVFLVAENEKCGKCNRHSDSLYLIASSEDEAKRLYEESGYGLCGFCLARLLYEKGTKINE